MKQLCSEQLFGWGELFKGLVHQDFLRLYRLLSGAIDDQVLIGLDWIRAFGLYLLYGTAAHEPLEEAAKKFAQHWPKSQETSLTPLPYYLQYPQVARIFAQSHSKEEDSGVLDVCYHLLNVFSNSDYSLEKGT